MSVEVTCPRCAFQTVFQEIRRSADEFCPDCDFPLFWAGPPSAEGVDESGDAFRRLPGAEGRDAIGDRECPHCGERNSISRQLCVRCNKLLITPAAPIPAPLPWPAPHEPPPPLTDPPKWPVWAVAALLVIVIFLLVGYIWIW